MAVATRDVQALGRRHLELLAWCRDHWPRLVLPALFAEIFDIPKGEEDDTAEAERACSSSAAPPSSSGGAAASAAAAASAIAAAAAAATGTDNSLTSQIQG